MSEPTTEAGRALMEAMLRRGRWWASSGDAIVAIEQEAAAQERERIAEEVRGLYDEREDAPWGPDEFWVDREPYVRAAAVLAIVRGEDA